MKLVEQLRDRFGVEFVLRVLGIASSTYRGWVARQAEPSRRERDDRAITTEISDIHVASGGTYGSPRVHQVLRRRGIRVSRKRVERLMRQVGLQGAFLRKQWRASSTRRDPRAAPAPDRVNRDFSAPAPDRLWVADATRILCRSKSHRCWSGGFFVFVDEAAEDAGAEHFVGVEVVYRGGVLLSFGW
ncbi:IS3 family transposase [Saccharothrix stipae]